MTSRLILGDCLEVLPTLEAESIDLTVTSPPYDNLRTYNGYTFNFEGIAKELYRVTKQGGVLVWVVGDETKNGSESLTSFKQAIYLREQCGFNLHDTMIYEVSGTGAKGSQLSYWQAFEYMFVFGKGRPKSINRIADIKNSSIGLIRSGRYRDGGNFERLHATKEIGTRTNIWRYSVGFMDSSDKTDHPAPFPESLAADHIVSWSNAGDTVLDPMMGSGTTGKMATKLQRNFVGIEISSEYYAIAQHRIEQAESQLALFQL